MSLNEERMMSRALKQGWNIPPELRAVCIHKMGEIITQSKNERAVASAIQAVIAADRVTLAAAKLELEERRLEQRANPDPDSGRDYDIELSPPLPKKHESQTQDPMTPEA